MCSWPTGHRTVNCQRCKSPKAETVAGVTAGGQDLVFGLQLQLRTPATISLTWQWGGGKYIEAGVKTTRQKPFLWKWNVFFISIFYVVSCKHKLNTLKICNFHSNSRTCIRLNKQNSQWSLALGPLVSCSLKIMSIGGAKPHYTACDIKCLRPYAVFYINNFLPDGSVLLLFLPPTLVLWWKPCSKNSG